MDFVSHFLPGKVKCWTRLANTAFAAVIAGVFVKFFSNSSVNRKPLRPFHALRW